MSRQLILELPGRPALGMEDFFVSPSNAAAVEAVRGWRGWPQGKLVLAGPEGSGKTHLAHAWASMSGAAVVPAREVAGRIGALAGAPVAVDDADAVAGNREAEEALLHLHNLALDEGAALLIAASRLPARWGVVLPDLRSRLLGAAAARLAAPDDALLTAVLAKQFTDRQLRVGTDVLNFLVQRMERSFAGAGRLVEALDRAALEEQRRVTTRLAARVLGELTGAGA